MIDRGEARSAGRGAWAAILRHYDVHGRNSAESDPVSDSGRTHNEHVGSFRDRKELKTFGRLLDVQGRQRRWPRRLRGGRCSSIDALPAGELCFEALPAVLGSKNRLVGAVSARGSFEGWTKSAKGLRRVAF